MFVLADSRMPGAPQAAPGIAQFSRRHAKTGHQDGSGLTLLIFGHPRDSIRSTMPRKPSGVKGIECVGNITSLDQSIFAKAETALTPIRSSITGELDQPSLEANADDSRSVSRCSLPRKRFRRSSGS